MISKAELKRMARAKLSDAELLYHHMRFDGAIYLSGYVLEFALKARICTTLRWPGYPEGGNEFQNLRSFKVHDLDTLLHLSGIEEKIRTQYTVQWDVVAPWSPDFRYQRVGWATREKALDMITSTRILLGVL